MAPTWTADLLAGGIASLVIVAYCISFSALLFQGPLSSGLSMGLWSLLVGACVTGLLISPTTTSPPAESGPDNPAIAVMSVLAGTVSAPILARTGNAELAVTHVLLAITLATLATGLALYLLGAFELGQLVRFVPYPVIGGFLAASGWLLITGGIEIITGRDFDLLRLSISIGARDLPKIAIALAFAAGIFVVRQRTGSVLVLPAGFFGASVAIDLLLRAPVLAGSEGWYLSGSNQMKPWVPVTAAFGSDVDWWVLLGASAEIGSVAAVTVLALLLDVTGLEVARAKTADLDAEFRSNGLANIVVAPLGGLMGNLSLNASRLLDEAGSRTYMSGVFASIAVGLVVVTGFDLPSVIPAPILGGLLVYLGCLVLSETLLRSPAHRAWTDYALALVIMGAIVQFGYFYGVVLGFVGACLMFAFNYGRIGVVRRHLTRAEIASDVERAPEATQLLRTDGGKIHIFWLAGFIFFGSSNGLFERIRRVVQGAGGVRFIILDFAGVTGFDTSAVLSLVKLRNLCTEQGITLAYSGLGPAMLAALQHAKLFGPDQNHRIFANRNEALEWCEERLLAHYASPNQTDSLEGFEHWLARELGADAGRNLVADYLQRKDVRVGELLYRQGEPADTIDFVASGFVAVNVQDEAGRMQRIRRMACQTVVGEMGFFRKTARAASITAETPSVVFTLTRASYESLLANDHRLGVAFHHFIIRALADRVEFANQENAALL